MNFFEAVLTYIGIKALDKFFADNLPNLSLSKLKVYFLVLTLLGVIVYFTLLFKLTKDLAAKDTIIGIYVILVLYLAWPVIVRKKPSLIAD